MKYLPDRSTFYLTLIYVVATALIFFLMGLTYKHLDRLSNHNDRVYHSFDVSLALEGLYSEIKNMETSRRDYIVTGDRRVIKDLKTSEEKVRESLGLVVFLVRDNAEQSASAARLGKLVEEKLELVNTYIDGSVDYAADKEATMRSLISGGDIMKSISSEIDVMLAKEKRLLEERKSRFLFTQKDTPIYLYVISLFSLGLLSFAFFQTNRDFRRQRKASRALKLALETSNLAQEVGEYGIWTYDLEGKSYAFSENLYRLLGVSSRDSAASYGYFSEFVHPEDRTRIHEKFQEILSLKNVPPFKCRIIRKDGVLRHFQVVGCRVTLQSGEPIILGITTDITEEVEKELKLEGVNWLLKERNDNLSIASETYDEAEKIGQFGTWQWFVEDDAFAFSDNLIRLYGLEPQNFQHDLATFLPYVYPEDKAFVDEKIKQMYAEEDIEPFTHRILRRDGELRYISINSKRIDGREKGRYLLVIARDVTAEFLAKENIEQKNAILEANNEELKAFNYVTSHDLQEPLRKIETFISRLKAKEYDKLSETGQQYMDRTAVAAGNMRTLIDDLLQFSRTTRAEQVFETSDLNVLFSNATEELAQTIEDKKATISSDEMPVLEVVPFQIQQLFINLLSNSLKYAKAETPPCIEVRVEKVDASEEEHLASKPQSCYYKMTFRDNGIGFEQKYADRIFALFNRLHGKQEYKGTGIGLAICKKIVDNHNGYIFAEGYPQEGAVFTVYLPA
ncbi:ATP-binding protein [Bergeyella sp. RCAD1439]|uniref:ATP-binding protein n=1 Tax=Bergeyella anatis TaxID=3113737 RepID=UPI002E190FAE|nr:ATP-binding protein [Bergeyella sp. RCAD1439]